MSGVCAVWHENPARLGEVLDGVASGLATVPAEQVHQRMDTNAGVGIAFRFPTQQIYQSPRLLVACDADLLNEDELRGFIGKGEELPENARTAGLLASLYERFGNGFVEKLRGGFSVVVRDRRERKLVAAIDGFGINRLVYHQGAQVLMVATRIDALARSGIDLKVNPRAIVNYLNFTSNLAPETIFTEVHRLQPGMILIAEGGKIRLEKYWDMRYGVGSDTDEGRLSRTLESMVERAVAVHCRNDSFSSLGAFLSGGTDSSTVTGMMSRMAKGPVKTFSIGYQEQSFNELGYAQIAADRFKTDHHTYLVGAADCAEALPGILRSFDEPFGNSSAIPTYFCAKLAADNGVKVLLAGDGGDELFGGNERYLSDKVFGAYHAIPPFVRKGLIEPGLRLAPFENGLFGKARRYVRRANLPPAERYFSGFYLRANDPHTILQRDFLAQLGDYSVLDIPARHYRDAPASDHLDRLLYVDLKITLADNDLPKVTCAAELAGIQTRFPFLDRAVAEFSGCIPPGLKVKGGEKRYLFKRAFRELLPVEIIKKKKHGFGIPVSTWMKTDRRMRELTHDTLYSSRALTRGYFERKPIEELFRMHEITDDSPYYGDMLWTHLMLELWHHQVVDQPVRMSR
jgi:asparagine synthase (glutamine-hydrolysing)